MSVFVTEVVTMRNTETHTSVPKSVGMLRLAIPFGNCFGHHFWLSSQCNYTPTFSGTSFALYLAMAPRLRCATWPFRRGIKSFGRSLGFGGVETQDEKSTEIGCNLNQFDKGQDERPC